MSAPLPEFQVIQPASVAGAIRAARGAPGSHYVAGGTDLLVNIAHGLERPQRLVDLAGIDEMSGVGVTETGVRIGANVSLTNLAQNALMAERYQAVAQAARAIAAPGHRNLGTLGGNLCLDTRCIYYNQSEWWRHAYGYCLKRDGDVCHVAPQGDRCHAAYSGDLAPALIVLQAVVEIASCDRARRIPLAALYSGDGRAHLTLAPGEIVVAVHLPDAPPPSGYAKTRTRGAIEFPLAGAAVALTIENGMVTSLRVGLTGTNPRPFLLEGTAAFIGCALDDAVLQRLDKLVQRQVAPMRTTTASAHYRRLAAAALVRRLAADLASQQEHQL